MYCDPWVSRCHQGQLERTRGNVVSSQLDESSWRIADRSAWRRLVEAWVMWVLGGLSRSWLPQDDFQAKLGCERARVVAC